MLILSCISYLFPQPHERPSKLSYDKHLFSHVAFVVQEFRSSIEVALTQGLSWDGWMASPTQWTWVWVNSTAVTWRLDWGWRTHSVVAHPWGWQVGVDGWQAASVLPLMGPPSGCLCVLTVWCLASSRVGDPCRRVRLKPWCLSWSSLNHMPSFLLYPIGQPI